MGRRHRARNDLLRAVIVASLVIPGPSQRVRPKVAGPMTGSARSPKSTTTVSEYGFRTRRCATIRNDACANANTLRPYSQPIFPLQYVRRGADFKELARW
jgi:hypothetical protein